jgi:tetratricopeptide (TPR) repeat protein
MKPLEAPDSHHLRAAIGWLELGNPLEAEAELARIPVRRHGHPEVVEVRWQISSQAGRWQVCVELGELLVRISPAEASGYLHRSYALHELKRTQEAFDLLCPVAQKFPEEAVIPYNLACYACQLGHLEQAKEWLKECYERTDDEDHWRLQARHDPDLTRLWPAEG